MVVAEVLRGYAEHDAERRSALTRGLLLGAADDWDAGGPVRSVLEPFDGEPEGAALPLRFTAALHRLVLTGRAPRLARHYATAGGSAAPGDAWPAAREVVAAHDAELRALVALPCQTNEVGRSVLLLTGLLEVARRTGAPVRLLEIGASAGLNLLLDRYRYGDVWGDPGSPCRLPGPGTPADVALRIVERAGCDPAPLDPTEDEDRLRLCASVWGDQPERLARLRSALAVAARHRVLVERAGAADWLARRLGEEAADGAVTVVWHSVVRRYVDPGEWARVERLTDRPGTFRLAFEVEPGDPRGTPLRLHSPGERAGEVLAHGTGHGPPVTIASRG